MFICIKILALLFSWFTMYISRPKFVQTFAYSIIKFWLILYAKTADDPTLFQGFDVKLYLKAQKDGAKPSFFLQVFRKITFSHGMKVCFLSMNSKMKRALLHKIWEKHFSCSVTNASFSDEKIWWSRDTQIHAYTMLPKIMFTIYAIKSSN